MLKICCWNVLADCYGYEYFDPCPSELRWRIICLRLLQDEIDIFCLQEADFHDEFMSSFFNNNGYNTIYLRRPGRLDGCVIGFKRHRIKLLRSYNINFDDIASDHPARIKQKFLRQNCGIIAYLSLVDEPEVKFWVTTCHLYWNPNYPEVKRAQALYLLSWLESLRRKGDPVIMAGDFNSLPTSEVYQIITTGRMEGATLPGNDSKPKFICDASLNRLCRWLRMLGVDTLLETTEEHDERARGNFSLLFERTRAEQRILLTTSKTLLMRSNCPGSFFVSPKDLQAALGDLCLCYNLDLVPSLFLTICIKCNGIIEATARDDPRLLRSEKMLPPDVPMFICSSCLQPYWWSDIEDGPAVRAKNKAEHLYRAVTEYRQAQLSRSERREDEITVGPVRQRGERDQDERSKSARWGSGETCEHGPTVKSEEEETMNELSEALGEWQIRRPRARPLDGEKFRSVIAEIHGNESLVTNRNGSFSGVIDYIFVTGNVNVLSATVTPSDFHGLQMTDCQWESSWPSDHAMVVAELDLKTGTGIE